MAAQEPLCGILNVDKPLEWTSHEVVAAVRKWSRQRRIGHAGTLDPLATGVLLLCLGKATRVSPYLVASTKVYRATLRLGVSTTTHDAEGEVVARRDVDVSREQFESILPRFVGQIDQVPPVYSAVKRQGKRLYEYARQGVEVQVPPRTVEIHSLSTVDWTPPKVILNVACGPGTYVRALARDLGQALGCGASLVELRRVQSGIFRAEQAVPLGALKEAYADSNADAVSGVRALIRTHLHPLDLAFAHLPSLVLDAKDARRLTMGQGVEGASPVLDAKDARRLTMGQGVEGAPQEMRGPGLVPVDGHSRTYKDAQTHSFARAYGPGKQFLALVAWHEDTRRWRPRKVFTQPSELL